MNPLALGALIAALALTAVPAAGSSGSPMGRPADRVAGAPVNDSGRAANAAGTQRAGPLQSGTWPVWPPVVVTDFDDPPPYQAGHRGLDLMATPGQVVVAAGAGSVTTAGQVAGRPVVVVAHVAGVRTTYLPVSPLVGPGDEVRAGDPIGVLAPPPHCTATCLHWGARRGGRYLDPRSLLPPDAGPIVLLPTSS